MKEIKSDVMHSKIWQEEAEADNPFAAANCYCRGYDVFNDLLGKASYFEYLFLLLQGEKPSSAASLALERLALVLANPGPREASVHAAMGCGISGAPAQASLMAALAVGAGSYGGAREVYLAMCKWQELGMNLPQWQASFAAPPEKGPDTIWPTMEHPAGFDPYSSHAAAPVLTSLQHLSDILPDRQLSWLLHHRLALEQTAGQGLAMTGVAAAAFGDLGFSPQAGEMLFLMLRLPGVVAHTLEQTAAGYRQFPFFTMDLQDDPGPAQGQASQSNQAQVHQSIGGHHG